MSDTLDKEELLEELDSRINANKRGEEIAISEWHHQGAGILKEIRIELEDLKEDIESGKFDARSRQNDYHSTGLAEENEMSDEIVITETENISKKAVLDCIMNFGTKYETIQSNSRENLKSDTWERGALFAVKEIYLKIEDDEFGRKND